MATLTIRDTASSSTRTITYGRVSELRGQHPPAPLQNIADHATELAEFDAACTAASNPREYRAALCLLRQHHCRARLDDVPEAKRTAFQAFVRQSLSQYDDLNSHLDPSGGAGAWR